MVFLTDFSSGSEKWFQLFVHCTPPLLPAAVLSDPHPEVNNFAKSNICNNVKNGFVWKIGENWKFN